MDILVLTESKLEDYFPNLQSVVDEFSEPFKSDRNRPGGGVMIYVRDDCTSKLLTNIFFSNDILGIFEEMNVRKCKWLLLGTYHPTSQSDQYVFENADKAFDMWNCYDKNLLTEDFNVEISDHYSENILYQHELKVSLKGKLVL